MSGKAPQLLKGNHKPIYDSPRLFKGDFCKAPFNFPLKKLLPYSLFPNTKILN